MKETVNTALQLATPATKPPSDVGASGRREPASLLNQTAFFVFQSIIVENGPRLSFTRWRNVAPSSCPESRVVLPAGEISPLCINMEGNCAVFSPSSRADKHCQRSTFAFFIEFSPLNPGRSWVPGRKHYVANEGKQRGKRRPWACLRASVTA